MFRVQLYQEEAGTVENQEVTWKPCDIKDLHDFLSINVTTDQELLYLSSK